MEKEYKCILFDLDGTLANTFPGILHSYQYASEKVGFSFPSEQMVGEAIGAPLAEVFRERFNLSEELVEQALVHYREYYAKNGLYEVESYEGMRETLSQLKELGYYIGVTTLKNESFAKKMLEALGLSQYFDTIIGMDDRDVLTKSGMIIKALEILESSQMEAVLVGDSSYDAIGANEAGIDFIVVTYGFGFKCEDDAEIYKKIGVVNSPMELLKVIAE